jgi:signal transduction histidine kinase
LELLSGDVPVATATLLQVIRHVPDGVVLLDAKHRIKLTNDSGRALLELLTGRPDATVVERLGDLPIDHLVELAQDGVPHDLVVRDGARVRIITVRALRQIGGAGGTLLLLRDATRVRQAQAERATRERLALVGELAGGLAHDFNNVLTLIIGEAGRIRKGDDSASADAIIDACMRAAGLAKSLLAFTRREAIAHAAIDLAAMLRVTHAFLQRLVGSHIRIELDVPDALPTVHAHPSQVERILANLVVNARDAMPNGGTIGIAAASAGPQVHLVVRDDGQGMDEETRLRASEPYFSTREGGHGFGLATVHATVEELAGRCLIESEVDRGTAVHIWLPIAGASA